uniref:Uncharacterized protein n=1 Tax=Nelumbo nucifera TaxID=4432 RepID=A0A822XG26_NELNU|nr:TPA_asm: hypothetical protein HUJ06_020106 [Nelumbo nucifera]
MVKCFLCPFSPSTSVPTVVMFFPSFEMLQSIIDSNDVCYDMYIVYGYVMPWHTTCFPSAICFMPDEDLEMVKCFLCPFSPSTSVPTVVMFFPSFEMLQSIIDSNDVCYDMYIVYDVPYLSLA